MVSRVMDAEQLRATQRLIDAEPTVVVLERRENRTRTGAGGVSGGGDYKPVVQDASTDPATTQVTVFLGAKVQDDLPLQMNDGERVVAYYTLVAMPGINILENDRFTYNDIPYTVVSVHRHLDYEVKADVETYYGGHH